MGGLGSWHDERDDVHVSHLQIKAKKGALNDPYPRRHHEGASRHSEVAPHGQEPPQLPGYFVLQGTPGRAAARIRCGGMNDNN